MSSLLLSPFLGEEEHEAEREQLGVKARKGTAMGAVSEGGAQGFAELGGGVTEVTGAAQSSRSAWRSRSATHPPEEEDGRWRRRAHWPVEQERNGCGPGARR